MDDDDKVTVIHTKLIDLNSQGKYWQYLNAYAKNNDLIQANMETNNGAGALSPSTGRMYFMDAKF